MASVLGLVVAFLAVIPDLSAAEAEPWPQEYAVTLRVSPDEAAADFSRVQAALDEALKIAGEDRSVRVVIGPGVYREHVELVGEPDRTYAPVAIVAEYPGRAVLSGSRIVNGWRIGDDDCFAGGAVEAGEGTMVFVQGVRLERVRPDRLPRAGQYRVVEKQIRLVPPANATVADGLVEVADELPGQVLCIQNMDTVLVSGLYVRQSGGEGVRVQACGAVRFEHVTSEHHFISGYHFEDLERLRLVNSDALRNGKEGVDIVNVGLVEVVSGSASMNGFRAAERRMMDGDAFGLIANSVREMSLRNFQAADNLGTGLGVFYTTQLDLARSKLLNNRTGMTVFRVGKVALKEVVLAANSGGGLLVMESECAAAWSVFAHNGEQSGEGSGAQIVATDHALLSLERCIVSGGATGARLLEVESLATLGQLSGNLYWGEPDGFQIGSAGTAVDFATWQALTGQDLNSAWGDPMFNDPAYFEFIPLGDSIWYRQKDWPVRALTESETTAARRQYLGEDAAP
ncbi:hypothetical protein H5P28_08650 [Ruficoccus amylovorans]|uniref:Right handed beta helix domain-containing protein n=1 Tax=Ruficoccus amylovorans TaxID=1804625 RepID=A0A842HDN7_9BACT|nr:hypothetical protein [Ruficoccus amylovorans]MBC2594330.1 hypothetical protein [Ruficoccus amylovorans]